MGLIHGFAIWSLLFFVPSVAFSSTSQHERIVFHEGCFESSVADGWIESAASAYCWCTSEAYGKLSQYEKIRIIKEGESAIPDYLNRVIADCARAFPSDKEAVSSGPYYSSGALRPPPRPLLKNSTLKYWHDLEPELWEMAQRVNHDYRDQGENTAIPSELWAELVVKLVRKRIDAGLDSASSPEERASYLSMMVSSFPVLDAMQSSGGVIWDKLVNAETALMQVPEYMHLSLSERFEIVVESLHEKDRK